MSVHWSAAAATGLRGTVVTAKRMSLENGSPQNTLPSYSRSIVEVGGGSSADPLLVDFRLPAVRMGKLHGME